MVFAALCFYFVANIAANKLTRKQRKIKIMIGRFLVQNEMVLGNSKGTKQLKLFWKTGKQQRAPNSQGFSPVLKAGGWTPPTRWRKGNRKFHLCRHPPLHIESQGTIQFYLLKQDFSIWRPLFVHLILHCCFKEAKIK